MKRTWLTLIPVLAMAWVVPVSADEARAAFDQAQILKRNGRFDEARAAFQELASSSSDATWSSLASDELRFGLPLHESNVLLSQLARAADHPARTRLLKRVESIYQTLLNDNADRPERIAEIERKRDQLSLLGQAASNDESDGLAAGLGLLRSRIENHHRRTGRWPDRRQIESDISSSLRSVGLAPERLTLYDFYPSSTSFYATLHDSSGGAEIKIKGDGHRVTVEGGGR